MIKIVTVPTLAPETLAFIRKFGYQTQEIVLLDEKFNLELVTLNNASPLLVILSDEIVHYNIDDLVAFKLSHPGQIYCYRELTSLPTQSTNKFEPKTYKKFPGLAEPLTSTIPYHDAFFAQGIFFLPAKALSKSDIGAAFSSMVWHLLPMPRYLGIFPRAGGKPVLFLDRDGVVNVDKSYVYKIDDCEIIPEVYPILEWAKENNFVMAVLTNQSGIGRGMYTIDDANGIHVWMAQHFAQRGLCLGDFEMAPFHHEGIEGPLKKHSHLRKPYPGMALKVGERIPISLRRSFMIGDKTSDILWLPLLRSYIIQGRYELGSDVFSCQNLREVLKKLSRDSTT